MRTRFTVLLSTGLLVASACLAQTPAVTSISGGTQFATIDLSPMTAGWSFTTNSNIVVSAIGIWQPDTSQNLVQTHQVGLWTSGGTLVTSGTVAVNGPVTGSWRYIAVSPVLLLAGQTFVVGGSLPAPGANNDQYSRVPVSGGSVITSALITIGTSMVSNSNSGFAFPGTSEPTFLGRFGPNLMIAPAAPATVTKLFGAASVPVGGTTSLTINITNPNALPLTGINFTDTLPAGLVVAATPNLATTCSGTATAVGGSGSVSLGASTLAAAASCSVSVNVTGNSAGMKVNSVVVGSTEGGNSTPATASINVDAPPTIAKAFGAASIALNATTSLTFTLSDPAGNPDAAQGVAFSDTLPAGLTVASGASAQCGGTLTTTAPITISFTGGTIAANSNCQFSVTVTGATSGNYTNTTGAVSSTNGGTGGTATAPLAVEGAPTLAKAFNPTSILLNGNSTLTFTITNPASNPLALAGVAFTDTLPAGLSVVTAATSQCGGTLTTTAPTSISFTGGSVAVNSSCQFSVVVTGAAAGNYTNTTGAISSTNGGTGNTATANVAVGQTQATVPMSPWTLAFITAGLTLLALWQLRRRPTSNTNAG